MYNYMKCKKCGHEYKQEIGTLNIYDKGNFECPLCKGEVYVDREKGEKQIIEEQERFKSFFKDRKKRV